MKVTILAMVAALAPFDVAGTGPTGLHPQQSTTAQGQNAAAKQKGWVASNFRKPPDEELKKKLTPLQYQVTQKERTERAFSNEYWNNHEKGIYVDVVSGEPLFSSFDKYESGTGWPSFTKPLERANVKIGAFQFLQGGSEVRSAHANSHLGHIFDDGPPPAGKRYCMNSAAMRFIPADKLVEEGYGQYLPLFQKKK